MVSLIFSSDAPPKLFQYNQSSQQVFYYFDNVMINNNHIEENDWVIISLPFCINIYFLHLLWDIYPLN